MRYIDVDIKTAGVGRVQLNIATLTRRGNAAIKKGIDRTGREILIYALGLVPKKSGDLESSGRLGKIPFEHVNSFTAQVTFGGPLAPYAEYQHEWPSDKYRKPTTPGTEPYWLKKALRYINQNDLLKKNCRVALGEALKGSQFFQGRM